MGEGKCTQPKGRNPMVLPFCIDHCLLSCHKALSIIQIQTACSTAIIVWGHHQGVGILPALSGGEAWTLHGNNVASSNINLHKPAK